MSRSIWTRCGGRSNAGPLACEPWRVVESQRIAATRPLVDSDAEQAVLEALIDGAKPPLPAPDFAGLHYLLYSPFRYPPLRHGSRFGRRHERSLWYGAEALSTALAETAYYRLVFFEGTAARLAPHTLPMSAFQARVRTAAGVDLAAPAFRRHLGRICSPTDYAASQALGSEMRADGIEVFRFPSARDPDRGMNVALFTPRAFAAKRPLRAPETWLCTITAAHDVEFRHERATGIDAVGFRREAFLVDGALPFPGSAGSA
jgi:RES domain